LKRVHNYVVLLRGINVGGHNKIGMAALKLLLKELGYLQVQTYIASGNVVLQSHKAPDLIEANLEQMIEKEFQCKISIVVRTEKAWMTLVSSNPFETLDPHRLKSIHFGLTKNPLQASAMASLQARAQHGETIHLTPACLWIDFADGLRDTKLTPLFLEKCLGSPVTLRNLNTVARLSELLRALPNAD
jgi:uncharacterized protein (DUF1697 family)